MIFSVQRYLEDYFVQRGLTDVDQYAIRIANAFDQQQPNTAEQAFVDAISKLRTAFYSRNRNLDRRAFEIEIARKLRQRFKKKRTNEHASIGFIRAIPSSRKRFRTRRRSINQLLSEYKMAVEARGIGSYWSSRKKGKLRSYPERIAQDQLALFAKGVLGPRGLVIRESASGIGYVDVGIAFAAVLHLIELKVFSGGRFKGASQLAQYMKTENKSKGWLILIDTRNDTSTFVIPDSLDVPQGRIVIVVIRLNPIAPSKLK